MTADPDPRFWQAFGPPLDGCTEPQFLAALADGTILPLPIRPLADGEHGLASLIINQASFAVQNRLAGALADALRPYAPEIVVGLPTLGLTVAAAAAQALGHDRYVAASTSRKFWYTADLTVPLSSVTTPDPKSLWLDPRVIPLLQNARVALVDDVSSTGRSLRAGLALLQKVGVTPVCAGVVMQQTNRARSGWPEATPLVSVLQTPLLRRTATGWTATDG